MRFRRRCRTSRARARLVAISPQTQSEQPQVAAREQRELPDPVGPGNEVAARFGLRFELPGYLVELYPDTFKNDLGRINGEPSWTLPIGGGGYVSARTGDRYAEVNPDYTRRPIRGTAAGASAMRSRLQPDRRWRWRSSDAEPAVFEDLNYTRS